MELVKPDELHPVLLDLGKAFAEICERNGIRYWMLGGTQLGAVRHKGFIPWDDDMDFGVLNSDFPRLLALLREQLPANYSLRTKDDTDSMFGEIIKIEDKRTLIKEFEKENYSNVELGINIDIFPLYLTDDNLGFLSPNWMIRKLLQLQYHRFFNVDAKELHRRVGSFLIRHSLFMIRDKNFFTNIIQKHFIKDSGDFIANFYGAWGNREIVPCAVMLPPKKYEFEGTSFYGVANHDDYLSSLYGDYMKLPPEDKRHLHIDKMYWK